MIFANWMKMGKRAEIHNKITKFKGWNEEKKTNNMKWTCKCEWENRMKIWPNVILKWWKETFAWSRDLFQRGASQKQAEMIRKNYGAKHSNCYKSIRRHTWIVDFRLVIAIVRYRSSFIYPILALVSLNRQDSIYLFVGTENGILWYHC